jgi:hypothetical protein
MLCPVCLSFGTESEAKVQVEGTLYCSSHGTQAFERIGRGVHSARPWMPVPAE